MRRNPGKQTRILWTTITICAVIAAAAGATAAVWPQRHHQAALSRPSCGSAETHFLTGRTQFLSADPGALTCFARAARECRPAGLGVTEMGVDAGTRYVFTIEPGTTPCQVTEQSQDYSGIPGASQGALSTMPCHLRAVTRAGVILGCRGRDLLIPARVSAG